MLLEVRFGGLFLEHDFVPDCDVRSAVIKRRQQTLGRYRKGAEVSIPCLLTARLVCSKYNTSPTLPVRCISPPLLLSIAFHHPSPRVPLYSCATQLQATKHLLRPIYTLAAAARLKHFAMALQTPATDATAPLFSTELISPEVLKALPEGYTCRPIQRQDYHNGFLDVLRVLTTVGDVSEEVLDPLPRARLARGRRRET